MTHKMRYRLALDLGSTSIGWAMLRLNEENSPVAIIKTGVRIFSDGRNAKDKTSLAVTRREARAMRRRRDRLLKRKQRMMRLLIEHGFFPKDETSRKKLEQIDPYELRAKGLNEKLEPAEFARALFHINQRRGFKSNRKTDKKDNDSSALKIAIRGLREEMISSQCRTVGELLFKRSQEGKSLRARYRENKEIRADGKSVIHKSYDLYIDRAMIESEFDTLWAAQEKHDPVQFSEMARNDLKDALLFQRNLRPVKPGRCTLIPTEERAPLALPSTQLARIYQEANHLRILSTGLAEVTLTKSQRDLLVHSLGQNSKRSFKQISSLLDLPGATQFNFEDAKRQELKGNFTAATLSKDQYFGPAWHNFDLSMQDKIVMQILREESEAKLIEWLQKETPIDEIKAEAIANAVLPEGYGSLSLAALQHILPPLMAEVISYAEAVKRAAENGAPFSHHSAISHAEQTGEIMLELPYYGEALTRHVGFADPSAKETDSAEKRFGRIANPTVHIGLNQVRVVVNAMIKRYGHPAEVIVEVARDLKQSKEQKDEENKRQAARQKRNERWRIDIGNVLGIAPERVKSADLQKMQLWEELSHDIADRRCPYSGVSISMSMLFSDEVEIEHILPFSRTLDDSLNNKTVSLRQANRVKGNQTPWEAFGKQIRAGFEYSAMLERAQLMPKAKRYRFAEDAYDRWMKEDKDFLARALNDTRYLSRIAREYLSLICPSHTRVIPGQMTAMLRAKFGLNEILGLHGEKNRNDHRHHAVDACVIGVTDQGMLQRFSQASEQARERGLTKLVESMPLPWPNYRDHVARSISQIWVSHKPDHGYEGAMHNDTAYALLENGEVRVHKQIDGQRVAVSEKLKVIPFSDAGVARHGTVADGSPKPYKGYKGDSNYCMEIFLNEKNKWESRVISTFDAYQIVRAEGAATLRNRTFSVTGKPLLMQLMTNDVVRLDVDGRLRTMRISNISGNGQIFMAEHNEANVDARNRSKEDVFQYISKMAGSLQKTNARKITISPIGKLTDPGFGS